MIADVGAGDRFASGCAVNVRYPTVLFLGRPA
jgi:hypothetical protein